MGNGNWGDEDDLDIDADTMLHNEREDFETNASDINTANESAEGSDIFIPPSLGPDPLQAALKKNPLISGLHVANGEF